MIDIHFEHIIFVSTLFNALGMHQMDFSKIASYTFWYGQTDTSTGI